MNELQAVERFLVSTLRADDAVAALVGTRVYAYQVPENGTFPCVLVALNTALDTNAVGADQRLFTRATYLVKAISKQRGSMAEADAIAAALDAALVGQTGTVEIGDTTYDVRGCYRAQPVRLVMGAADTRYNHVGGFYRMHVAHLD